MSEIVEIQIVNSVVGIEKKSQFAYETPNGVYRVKYHGIPTVSVSGGNDVEYYEKDTQEEALNFLEDAVNKPWDYI